MFCPVLPFTQIPWPLTSTTWKQLSTLTSQVSGSVSPYLVARLLRSTSCYGVPVILPIPSSGAAASVLESATTSDRLSGHPSCPYCVVCPTDLLSTLPAVSSQCPVNKLQLSIHLHLGPISCRSLTEQTSQHGTQQWASVLFLPVPPRGDRNSNRQWHRSPSRAGRWVHLPSTSGPWQGAWSTQTQL